MSIYVTSDIHGCYDKFIKLLEEIKFSKRDELYIIGDIIDRGNKSLEILDYIREHKNIHLLKGNHEDLFVKAYESGSKELWYHNGGRYTDKQLKLRGEDYTKATYEYMKALPITKVIDKFILVHAGLVFPDNYNDIELEDLLKMQIEKDCLWVRPYDTEVSYRDYTIICGHTPVCKLTDEFLDENTKIVKRAGTIFIDCGCVFGGRLSCLRLDDMKEFYV